MRGNPILTWVSRGVGLLLAVSALLQLNDPDPGLWIAIYAAGAAACFLAPHSAVGRVLAAGVAAAAVIWAATYLTSIPQMRFGHLFGTMKAESPAIEEARELLGLAILAGWMIVLVVAGRRRRA